MRADEALALLDQLLPGRTFSNLQETVFSQVWEGKTYAEIAESCGYDHSYIRDVGFRLWQALSESLNQKVSKSNIRAVLERHARSQSNPATTLANLSEANPPPAWELPNGPVPLQSKFYIERPPLESQAKAELLKPGSLIRLKAPRQMGKTSLLLRLVAQGQANHMRCVTLSLHRADRQIFADLDLFLRWFCANVSYQLGLEPDLERRWHRDIGSKVSCTAYFEDYVLPQAETPLLIALDEVNELFQYPRISAEFLPLLRSWYEDAREMEVWGRVRWILSHATEVYVPLQLHQSPFNVGLPLRLPSFTLAQVQDLAWCHQLPWAVGSGGAQRLESLLQVVSCRPGLVRLALYALAQGGLSLEQLIEEAPTQSGIYSDHLRELLAALYPHPELQVAFRHVIESAEPVTLEPIAAYRLESLGLVTLSKNLATPSCELYRQYFLAFLPPSLSSTYG
ncbi:AAA-like domain-containing protein [Nodosilinea sp. LEGE 06152]|uniref:AAA-like domain-containing protein n=1 Tax=Nodosilinea sp. LEGE 06152 TaxID=2777966 RepID=UPI0018804EC5|nr:AAA-like domain-containing protein [Nodosilinea sp. LEGE 06152]MBE9160589.1 AAA-like domain-containing protein [Nodosilinea sp. LEGE 06152]